MKLLKAKVINFASYDDLEFDFQDLGLSLVYGPTGSGKSTLLDIIPWILFGRTAKNGNVDEVRSWNNLEEPTTGEIECILQDTTITITRTRGKQSQNDLYWTENGLKEAFRGKDIPDTQKLINQRLGIDLDSYVASSYYCEFSQVSTFFTGTTKHQREVFEKIANLDLPVKLLQQTTESKKSLKAQISELDLDEVSNKSELKTYIKYKETITSESQKWKVNKDKELANLIKARDNFESDKHLKINQLLESSSRWDLDRLNKHNRVLEEIETINIELHKLDCLKCPACGRSESDSKLSTLEYKLKTLHEKEQELTKLENPYNERISIVKKQTNTFIDQVEKERNNSNPFLAQLKEIKQYIPQLEYKINMITVSAYNLVKELNAVSQLYDISFELRGQLLKRIVKEIELNTNKYLENHFDSELKVEFKIDDSDKLEVNIQKSGYDCVFRQLSKGQRQLLKLCFGISVMDASANRAGIHSDALFFDEALDGLDSDLKIKAFDLFTELEKNHGSILVIDHSSELKELFHNRYKVCINGDTSEIENES